MKAIITLIVVLFSITGSMAQTPIKQQTPQEMLKQDIKSNKVTLYILGGIAARVYKEDGAFCRKFKIGFHDFGCLAPLNLDFYSEYNQLVFDYLNEQYGTDWQKEIRKDILGWEKWKKKA